MTSLCDTKSRCEFLGITSPFDSQSRYEFLDMTSLCDTKSRYESLNMTSLCDAKSRFELLNSHFVARRREAAMLAEMAPDMDHLGKHAKVQKALSVWNDGVSPDGDMPVMLADR